MSSSAETPTGTPAELSATLLRLQGRLGKDDPDVQALATELAEKETLIQEQAGALREATAGVEAAWVASEQALDLVEAHTRALGEQKPYQGLLRIITLLAEALETARLPHASRKPVWVKASPINPQNIRARDALVLPFWYRNHKDDVSERHVIPTGLRYGVVPGYYPEPQWLLDAFDLDKEAPRTFAISRFIPDPNLYTHLPGAGLPVAPPVGSVGVAPQTGPAGALLDAVCPICDGDPMNKHPADDTEGETCSACTNGRVSQAFRDEVLGMAAEAAKVAENPPVMPDLERPLIWITGDPTPCGKSTLAEALRKEWPAADIEVVGLGREQPSRKPLVSVFITRDEAYKEGGYRKDFRDDVLHWAVYNPWGSLGEAGAYYYEVASAIRLHSMALITDPG